MKISFQGMLFAFWIDGLICKLYQTLHHKGSTVANNQNYMKKMFCLSCIIQNLICGSSCWKNVSENFPTLICVCLFRKINFYHKWPALSTRYVGKCERKEICTKEPNISPSCKIYQKGYEMKIPTKAF